MAAISVKFGSGGANLTPNGSAGSPNLATALRDIADDLALAIVPPITSPDGTDAASTQTLANEIKAKLNAIQVASLLTTKV